MAERSSKAFFDALDKQTAVIPNISDSELRARIYREAMIDAENENKRLREENERLKQGVIDSGLQLSKLLDKERELERRMKAVSTTLADAIEHLKV